MVSESKASYADDIQIVRGMLTAWFFGSPLQGEKVVFESVAGMDVADLKDALVAKLRDRVNLGSFSLFRAERSRGDDTGTTSWIKSGAVLDAMKKLTEVCGTSDLVVLYVEPATLGSYH